MILVGKRGLPVKRPTKEELMGIEQLEPLIGEWKLEVGLPGSAEVDATCACEWILGGAFLQQRNQVDHPDAPDAVCVVGLDGQGGFTQHYFDSRGVARLYEMKFAAGRWELLRVNPDFTPLDFSQRYVAQFSDDRSRIEGRWESSRDGQNWDLDFQLNYIKLA
jgi:hypothetical protein